MREEKQVYLNFSSEPHPIFYKYSENVRNNIKPAQIFRSKYYLYWLLMANLAKGV